MDQKNAVGIQFSAGRKQTCKGDLGRPYSRFEILRLRRDAAIDFVYSVWVVEDADPYDWRKRLWL